ncbi:uncharacterized protein OCT59_027681 [Rhizophagus irregularis]|uniref:uncharacterized protein n=1 Tax=Rhizophagus irregularis TaxID=588596 RepID=UPI0019F306C2|nr:hypothetical protein OCT59_027681 [Rhizophagus irregularis]GBC15775.2 hypothetical protein RIR_jg28245.t1 [Rhizophagus irregularis DAOM 181602=DAOM 197198]
MLSHCRSKSIYFLIVFLLLFKERLLTIQAILGFDSEITSDLASSCLDMEDSKLTDFLVPLFRTLDTLRSLFNIIM